MYKYLKVIISTLSVSVLASCVTENFENDNSNPTIKNESTSNEVAMTRISLGLGYLNMGNTTQAKLNLEKAKRFAPDLVQVYTAFAHYYDTVDEPELAIESYEKALSLDPNDADTLNNYGVFLCRQKRYDDAEKQILKAIAVPSYLLVSQSYENLAMCQLKNYRFEKAEFYFTKAVSHNPSNANVYLHVARLDYAKGDYVSASRHIQQYEKVARRYTPEELALAYKVNLKQKKHTAAKNYANLLVKMFPNSYEAKQYLLNELAFISADQLAKDYQLYMKDNNTGPKKKRVVVLSPNKDNSALLTAPKKSDVSAKQPDNNQLNETVANKPEPAIDDSTPTPAQASNNDTASADAALVGAVSAVGAGTSAVVSSTSSAVVGVSAVTAAAAGSAIAAETSADAIQNKVQNTKPDTIPVNNESSQKALTTSQAVTNETVTNETVAKGTVANKAVTNKTANDNFATAAAVSQGAANQSAVNQDAVNQGEVSEVTTPQSVELSDTATSHQVDTVNTEATAISEVAVESAALEGLVLESSAIDKASSDNAGTEAPLNNISEVDVAETELADASTVNAEVEANNVVSTNNDAAQHIEQEVAATATLATGGIATGGIATEGVTDEIAVSEVSTSLSQTQPAPIQKHAPIILPEFEPEFEPELDVESELEAEPELTSKDDVVGSEHQHEAPSVNENALDEKQAATSAEALTTQAGTTAVVTAEIATEVAKEVTDEVSADDAAEGDQEVALQELGHQELGQPQEEQSNTETLAEEINNEIAPEEIGVSKAEVAKVEVSKADVAKAEVSKADVAKVEKAKPVVVETPFHRVKKGESLYYISSTYNIQIRALTRWNNIKNNRIRIGQKIYLDDPNKAVQ